MKHFAFIPLFFVFMLLPLGHVSAEASPLQTRAPAQDSSSTEVAQRVTVSFGYSPYRRGYYDQRRYYNPHSRYRNYGYQQRYYYYSPYYRPYYYKEYDRRQDGRSYNYHYYRY